MRGPLQRLLLAGVLSLICVPFAFAQGATTAVLSGVVVDGAGGVIPGATVSIKNNATGTTTQTVTNGEGTFSVPALEAGVYTITVSLQGFKTAVIGDVQLTIGAPTQIKAALEVGSLAETVVVEGGSSIVNTVTPTISSSLNADQINKIPLPTRNALNAVTFLPGVNTAGVNRDSDFNGLPQSFIAISLDGVNNNENYNKATDGFFAMVTPRQDAVEAVNVTSAVGGADIGGHGAVQISFVTRSGTNRFTGSGYEYHRNKSLNSNYWFNIRNGLPKNDVTLNQYGFRQGGPIVIPGLYDGHNKAFFFFNYEELRLPNEFSRSRNVLTPLAQQGIFRYERGTAIEQVNVLQMAAAAGFPITLNPLTQRILGYMNAAMQKTGQLNQQTDPNLMSYVWLSPGNQIEKQPVVRLDYNVSRKHRIGGVYNWQVVHRNPDQLNGADVRFPGAPNFSRYISYRPLFASNMRSTLSPNLVNELKGGIRWGPGYFGRPESNGRQTFEDTDFLAVDLTGGNLDLSNWHIENGPTARSAWSWNIDNILTWQKGKHSINMGTALYFGNVWHESQQIVPGIGLGLSTDDPAFNIFNTTSMPGASTGRLADARELYALLTGRVSSVTGQATLNSETGRYEFLGTRRREGTMNEYSVFIQDQWRITPTLTLNGGLRYDLQMPFMPKNDILTTATLADACGISGLTPGGTCQFFNPNASGGKVPNFQLLEAGNVGYKTDYNNLAPNIGVAWRPNVETGWLRTILGDPEQATIRAGFSIAYDRQGMERFISQFGGNPGSQLSLTRSVANGLLRPGIHLHQTDLLFPAPFPETPSYPIPVRSNRADDINIFHPDIEVASARTWTVSLQRAINKNTAIEARYVGTRGVNQWTEENWNSEYNIIENGFFEEFKLAMANLQANNAAGGTRAGSFRYFGPGTGTVPLPIYLAFLSGSRDFNNPNAYSGADWSNSTIAGRLVRINPSPYSAAADLTDNATRLARGIAAGYSPNFFIINPAVDEVNVWVSRAYSDYHALQLEVRRRLSAGLQINGSYQFAHEAGSANDGQRYGRVMVPSGNVRHAIKMQWDWSVPVGRDRRFLANAHPIINGIVGGWEFSGAGRIQARTLNFGNVRLVGMTPKDLQKMFKYRFEEVNGIRRVYILPADVILNTRRAYSVSTSSVTGYSALGVPEGQYIAPANSSGDCIQLRAGDCAPRTLLIRAPFFSRFDIGVTKRFPIQGRVNFELRVDVLNVFNAVNFNPVSTPGSGTGAFEVTSAYTDNSNTFDPGGRLGQLVFRLNW